MSYLISCKNGYLGIEPFSNHTCNNELYKTLCFLADQLSLSEFTSYLLEGQYFINLWTAIIILDRFRPKTSEKLIGLNDNKSIVKYCFETIEQYSTNFKQDGQFDNYQNWILEIKSSYS